MASVQSSVSPLFENCHQTQEHQHDSRLLPNGNTEKPYLSPRTVNQSFHRKNRGRISLLCKWTVEHQLAIVVCFYSLLAVVNIAFPPARVHARKFLHLSYYNDQTEKYALGPDDSLFVMFWIVFLTGLHACVIDYGLIPLASRIGIGKKKARAKFAEQAWLLCYHGTSCLCGMYLWYHSTYWLSLRALWTSWPMREIDGLVKYYYLVAFAFWLQQLVVVNIEEPRKDHFQMCTHHIVTCVLMFSSYCYHLTKVGNVILCLMDVVDLFLSLAKILKYLQFPLACDIAFGVFMAVWFFCRHVLFMAVAWSFNFYQPELIKYGCFHGSATSLEGPLPIPDQYSHLIQPFVKPRGLICASPINMNAFLIVLLTLQGILLIWLYMIFKVAYKVVSGQGATDTRSDDEISEADGDEDAIDGLRRCAESKPYILTKFPPIEKEVEFEEMRILPSRLNRVSSAGRTIRKTDGQPTETGGISLRVSSDRKQLLGRIGCDKGS